MTRGADLFDRLQPMIDSGRGERAMLEAACALLDAVDEIRYSINHLAAEIEDAPSDGTIKPDPTPAPVKRGPDPVPKLSDAWCDVPVKRGPGRPRKATR